MMSIDLELVFFVDYSGSNETRRLNLAGQMQNFLDAVVADAAIATAKIAITGQRFRCAAAARLVEPAYRACRPCLRWVARAIHHLPPRVSRRLSSACCTSEEQPESDVPSSPEPARTVC